MLAFDGGELSEEFVERVAALQAVEERCDGDPRTDKDGCTPEDVRITTTDASIVRPHPPARTFALAPVGCRPCQGSSFG